MSEPGFWQNQIKAAIVSKEAAEIENEIKIGKLLAKESQELLALANLAEKDHNPEFENELKIKLDELAEKYKQIEFKIMMSGEYDKNNVILAIHAGAGGTDAQDWAEMLLRMYLRYAAKMNFKADIVDKSSGGEAGLKSVVVEIKGTYAYGYYKSEAGVHRLVRVSPFDAEKMRHTSFALVEVLPELFDLPLAEIREEDLKIDVFRASGHGGQSVNTTDSAVRIKHLPTGIVVSCQNERSQLQNKQTAMRILGAKVYQYLLAEREEERQRIRGEFTDASWGNQARSYILHPYKLAKDHRTNYETQEVEKILDGELKELTESYLKMKK
jgi:peptide chain release factor 2